ncbi:hypothetical protein F1728_13650 [Gimesia benthica]|uniref:Uncharacterized protein n=1 Tax=Gimesia benthica TaxID=2608982 RepID=A0A6I6AFP3_9PLAN|nr:hypothetical protein [Gimesia benthica]QGQ23659.1 hypothetical protein F1728_13650 [Gimesia benthica]
MTEGGKLGCAISFMVFAIVLGIMGLLDTTQTEWHGDRWVIGKTYTRELSLDKSVGGHFEILKVEAFFERDSQSFPIVSLNKKPWDSSISFTVVKVKGVPVITGRKKIKAQFAVSVPGDSNLIGRRGDLTIRGVMRYPFMDLADAVGPGSKKYQDREVPFEKRISDIQIVADKSVEIDGPSGWESLLGLLLLGSILGGLCSLGMRADA